MENHARQLEPLQMEANGRIDRRQCQTFAPRIQIGPEQEVRVVDRPGVSIHECPKVAIDPGCGLGDVLAEIPAPVHAFPPKEKDVEERDDSHADGESHVQADAGGWAFRAFPRQPKNGSRHETQRPAMQVQGSGLRRHDGVRYRCRMDHGRWMAQRQDRGGRPPQGRRRRPGGVSPLITDVLDQIRPRDRAKALVGGDSQLPLVVPGVQRLRRFPPLQDPPPEFPLNSGREHGFQRFRRKVVDGQAEVPPPIRPARPSPALHRGDETIAVVDVQSGQRVEAGDAPNPEILAIPVQQRFAIREEVGMGIAVVFQDDSLGFAFEKPSHGRRDAPAAPKIFAVESGEDPAWPVDVVHQPFPQTGNDLRLPRPALPRPVAGQIQPRRTRLPDFRKYGPSRLRPVERDQQHGCRHIGGIVHKMLPPGQAALTTESSVALPRPACYR